MTSKLCWNRNCLKSRCVADRDSRCEFRSDPKIGCPVSPKMDSRTLVSGHSASNTKLFDAEFDCTYSMRSGCRQTLDFRHPVANPTASYPVVCRPRCVLNPASLRTPDIADHVQLFITQVAVAIDPDTIDVGCGDEFEPRRKVVQRAIAVNQRNQSGR